MGPATACRRTVQHTCVHRQAVCILIMIPQSLGENWRKQSKITASCFNDLNNEIVWSESMTQAHSMLRYWTSKPSVATIADNTRTLALNVMARAGFGAVPRPR